MSETATQLLATFELLPPHEQQLLLAEMLRRTRPISSEELTDEELVAVADNLFQRLDEREADGSEPN